MTVMQIRRTATLGGSPAPLSLLEGQLAVDMAEPNAPRLWVGVPASIDPTGQRVVNASATGFLPLTGGVLTGDVGWTNGVQIWTMGVTAPTSVDTPPGSFFINDEIPGFPHQRFVIEPSPGIPPAATRLLANGSMSLGGISLHFAGGQDLSLSTMSLGAGFLSFGLDNSIPVVVSFAVKNESLLSISEVDLADPAAGGHLSTAEIYLSKPNSHLWIGPSGWMGLGGKTISSPDSVLAPNYRDIAIHPYRPNGSLFPESNAILIHCDDGTGALAYQTTYNANQHNFNSRETATSYGYWDELGITLAVDPTLPMHAVTKQYADAITAGGGNFLPLSGGELIGPLAMTSAPQTWTFSVTDAAAVAPSIPGAFTITDTTEGVARLIIEPAAPFGLAPAVLPDPVIITGGAIMLNSKNVAAPLVNSGPFIFTDEFSMQLRVPTVNGVFKITNLDGSTILNLDKDGPYHMLYCHGLDLILQDGWILPQRGYKTNSGELITWVGIYQPAGSPQTGTNITHFHDTGTASNVLFACAPRISFLGAEGPSDSSPAGGINYYNASFHTFRSHDQLTEFGTWDANQLMVSKSVKTSNLAIADAVNYEHALSGEWVSNIARWGTTKGGTGVVRPVMFMVGGVEHMRLMSAGTTKFGSTQVNADQRLDIHSYLFGTTYWNAAITFGAPRMDSTVGGQSTPRGFIVVPGNATANTASLFMGSSSANGIVSGDAAAIRMGQSVMEIVSAGYVDFWDTGIKYASINSTGSSFFTKVTLALDPALPLEAATKQYVDAQASGGVTMSDTAPAAPTNGMLWFDSANVRLNIWYDDGTSAQWLSV